jgi:hypothetical protein
MRRLDIAFAHCIKSGVQGEYPWCINPVYRNCKIIEVLLNWKLFAERLELSRVQNK